MFEGLTKAFQPLVAALSSESALESFLLEFGWTLAPGTDITPVQATFAPATDAIAAAQRDPAAGVAAIFEALAALESVSEAGLPAPFGSSAFWSSFPEPLAEYLLYGYLESSAPALFALLTGVGVCYQEEVPADATAGRLAYVKRSISWAPLLRAVTSPAALPRDVYGWGEKFDYARAMTALATVARAFPIGSEAGAAAPEIRDVYYPPGSGWTGPVPALMTGPLLLFDTSGAVVADVKVVMVVVPAPAQGATPPLGPSGLVVFPVITGGASTSFSLTPAVTLQLAGAFRTQLVQVEIQPAGVTLSALSLAQLGVATSVAADLRIDAKSAPPSIVLGSPTSSRIAYSRAHFA